MIAAPWAKSAGTVKIGIKTVTTSRDRKTIARERPRPMPFFSIHRTTGLKVSTIKKAAMSTKKTDINLNISYKTAMSRTI